MRPGIQFIGRIVKGAVKELWRFLDNEMSVAAAPVTAAQDGLPAIIHRSGSVTIKAN